MDSLMYDHELDQMFYKKAVWYLQFAWVPKRCGITYRLIWLKWAYKGTAMWTGPGSPIFEYRWIAKEQFLFARLKGKI